MKSVSKESGRKNAILTAIWLGMVAALASTAAAQNPKQPNCLEQAGLSPDVAAQMKTINRSLQRQVKNICASLTWSHQQKLVKVRAARQTAQKKRQSLVSQDQFQTLLQCWKSSGQIMSDDPCVSGQ